MAILDALSSLAALLLTPISLLTIFVAYWAIWIVYTRFFHPLSNIPGPFIASITRAWLPWQIIRGDIEHTQRAFHAKYGPLMRIAPNEIACADGSAIKTVYPTKDPWTKTDFYAPWHNKALNPVNDYFSIRDEKLHNARRRRVNAVYSLSNVLRSEKYIDQCSELFIQRMGQFADSGQTVDFGEWLQMYAFDVIGEIFFGRMFGFMEGRHDHAGYIESLDTLMPPMVVTSVSASYARPFILGSAILNKAVRKGLTAIDHIANAARTCVSQRFEELEAGKDVRQDMLAQFITIHREGGEKVDFKVEDIQQECYVALFAGSDTTAIALRSVFYHLMKNPQTYDKLQKELDDAAAAGQLSSPAQFAEAIKLPYLCACIKEAMRLHPSVGYTMPRIVPKGGVTLCGQFIPEGYNVGLNGAVVQYDKEVFGDDAYKFNPSRWLERDAATMDKYMIHFGAGTRTCIGKNISISEIHKLVPQVLRHFTVTFADPNGDWKTMNQWFNKPTNMHLKLTRRL